MAMALRWLDRTTLPVEADGLAPKLLAGFAPGDVARLALPVGNDQAEVGELFEVARDATYGDDTLLIEGDLSHLRGLGRGLDRGRIMVRGDVGPHVGAGMSGGTIEVAGNAGDGAGAEMSGGLLRILGDAGHDLGGALAGSRLGMRDGVILIAGSVGDDAGRRMRRGLIAVGGRAGDGFGRGLVAGTLLAFGSAGRNPGSGMKRGTIGLFQDEPLALLPSFEPAGRHRFPFLAIYLRQLAAWGFPVPARVTAAALERYNGDRAVGGQGEILVLAGPGA
jgi:formylmethanofuran dehydrogenase subunit C